MSIKEYREANQLWLDAEEQYRAATDVFNKAYGLRVDRYNSLMSCAAELTELERKIILEEQFGKDK